MKLALRVSLTLSLFATVPSFAGPGDPSEARPPSTADVGISGNRLVAKRIQEAHRYAVKVMSTSANLFTPLDRGGHGTGFIVELSEDRGVIFTNHHVVRSEPLDARLTMLSFRIADGEAEQIPAEVVYESPFLDFAVIEFDPRMLRRARSSIAVAPLATEAEFKEVAAQGNAVLAYGYPLDSDNVSTDGRITAIFRNAFEGWMLQTQAPINPGNSGGPLIDIVSGKVIGINTAKKVGRGMEATGYAIPMTRLRRAYEDWRRDPSLGFSRAVLAHFEYVSRGDLAQQGFADLVRRKVPDFFERHRGLMLVAEAAAHTTLQRHDVIVTVNGEAVGIEEYRFQEIAQYAKGPLAVTVIRGKQLVDLQVPVDEIGAAVERQRNLFLMISGVVLQEYAEDRTWAIAQNESSVFVSHIVPLLSGSRTDLIPGAVLVEVYVDGTTFPIRKLQDLIPAIRAWQQVRTPLRLVVRQPLAFSDGQGGIHYVRDPKYGGKELATKRHIVELPVDGIVSPTALPLDVMRAHFDHEGSDTPATRLWQNWTLPDGACIREFMAQVEAQQRQGEGPAITAANTMAANEAERQALTP